MTEMNGAPVSLIVRVTKRTESCASESERARETNDETEREDAAAKGASGKEWSCCRACDERHSNVVRLSV